jgi:hypothetical protein
MSPAAQARVSRVTPQGFEPRGKRLHALSS